MRYINFIILFFLFNGCSFKLSENTQKDEYYLLEYKDKKMCKNAFDKKTLFIDTISASTQIDTRFINIKDGNKFQRLNGAKFMDFPSEFVRKAIIKAFYLSCEIEPKLVLNNNSYIFKSEILAFHIDKNKNVAVFEIAYSLDKKGKSVFSNIKRKEIKIKNDGIDSMNEVMNETINSILDDIENKLRN